jgi:hypothetical protein
MLGYYRFHIGPVMEPGEHSRCQNPGCTSSNLRHFGGKSPVLIHVSGTDSITDYWMQDWMPFRGHRCVHATNPSRNRKVRGSQEGVFLGISIAGPLFTVASPQHGCQRTQHPPFGNVGTKKDSPVRKNHKGKVSGRPVATSRSGSPSRQHGFFGSRHISTGFYHPSRRKNRHLATTPDFRRAEAGTSTSGKCGEIREAPTSRKRHPGCCKASRTSPRSVIPFVVEAGHRLRSHPRIVLRTPL